MINKSSSCRAFIVGLLLLVAMTQSIHLASDVHAQQPVGNSLAKIDRRLEQTSLVIQIRDLKETIAENNRIIAQTTSITEQRAYIAFWQKEIVMKLLLVLIGLAIFGRTLYGAWFSSVSDVSRENRGE